MIRRRRLALLLWLVPAAAHAQGAPDDAPPDPAPAATPAPVDQPPPQQPPPPQQQPPPPPDPVAVCKQLRHDMAIRASAIADVNERARVQQSMPDCTHVSPAALTTLIANEQAARAAAPPSPPLAPYHDTGFAFGAQLELVPIATLTTRPPTLLSETETSLFLGYQGDRFAVGGLVSLERASSSGASATVVQLGGSLRDAVARSESGATEMLLLVDGTYGSISSSGNMMEPTLYTFHIGPSIRHWLTPSFALEATGAVRFDVTSQDNASTTVIATLAYSLDLEGVF